MHGSPDSRTRLVISSIQYVDILAMYCIINYYKQEMALCITDPRGHLFPDFVMDETRSSS